MTDARLCAHCSEPLPPRSGRGRPATTHPGECRRLAHNAKRMQGRYDAYLAAIAPAPIGSGEDVRGTTPERLVDRSELYNDEGGLEGFHFVPDPPRLKRKQFLAAMNNYEEARAFENSLKKYMQEVPEDIRRKAALAPPIPYEEYKAMLRRNPDARPSPAFLRYEANREEIDAAFLALAESLAEAEEAEEAAKAKRRRKKTAA